MTHPQDKVLSLQWFLFRVRPNKERAVYNSVNAAGLIAAMPEVTYRKRVSRHSRKTREVSYPGLKSYVLVGFEGRPCFRDVLNLPFVSGVVGFDSFAARLNSKQVYAFLNNGAWDKRSVRKLVEEWKPDYKVEDTVALRGMGFGGVKGVVTSVDLASRRAKVVVPFLGSERELEVPVEAAYLADVA